MFRRIGIRFRAVSGIVRPGSHESGIDFRAARMRLMISRLSVDVAGLCRAVASSPVDEPASAVDRLGQPKLIRAYRIQCMCITASVVPRRGSVGQYAISHKELTVTLWVVSDDVASAAVLSAAVGPARAAAAPTSHTVVAHAG